MEPLEAKPNYLAVYFPALEPGPIFQTSRREGFFAVLQRVELGPQGLHPFSQGSGLGVFLLELKDGLGVNVMLVGVAKQRVEQGEFFL